MSAIEGMSERDLDRILNPMPAKLPDSIEQLGESASKKTETREARQKRYKNGKVVVDGHAFYCLGPSNVVRTSLATIVEYPYFEELIFYLIGINSVLLMIDEPTLTSVYSKQTINALIDTISFIYVIECAMKIVTQGFVLGKHAYLKDSFNIFDFTIVLLSLCSYFLEHYKVTWISLGAVKAFRALRALRPLKLVSKNQGMKLIVNSLLKSIPNIFDVLLIIMLFFSVFAILAV